MTHFFIDLWHDLREKRLWPVAVGLVAAIAAIPAVLFKPAGGAPSQSAPVASAAPSVGSTLPLVSVSDLPAQGSKLETFSQKNPFQPMKDLDKAQLATVTKPTTSSSSSSGASPSSAGHVAGGGGPTALTGGTSVPSSGGGSTGGSQTSSHTTTSSWTYTASFKFGTPDKTKTIKDANPFTPLPDESAPVLLFASADSSHAVFYLQDGSFQPQGEGKCDDEAKCRFVTLTLKDTGDEEAFVSADGTQEYDVQLLSIKKKSLDAAAKGASKGHGKAVKGAGAHASVATDAILPVLLGFSAATTTTTRHK